MLPLFQPVVATSVTHNPEDKLRRIFFTEGFRLTSADRSPTNNIKASVLATARLALILADARSCGSDCCGLLSAGFVELGIC